MENTTIRVRVKPFVYTTAVRWTGEKKGVISAAGKPALEVATPPEFKGHPGIWSPEDLFVASAVACVMSTFLAFAERAGLPLEAYEGDGEGTLEPVDGRFVFTRVLVRPRITLGPSADRAKAEDLIRKAEAECLITNSMRSEVLVEATIV